MARSRITIAIALLCGVTTGASAASLTFTEMSEQAGARVTHDPLGYTVQGGANVQDLYGPGVAIEDFNNDGWLDLFYCNGAAGNCLLLNNGDWTFTEATAAMGVKPSRVANGIAIADIDNDGRRDFVLGNFYSEPELYKKGDKFGEYASGHGIIPLLPGADPDFGPSPESMGAAWGDYNEDGFVDLYVANYRDQQDVLYRNSFGSYFFYDDTVDVTQKGFGFQGLFLDYDDDGDLDIYVANDFGFNFMFRNNGAAAGYSMTEVAVQDGIAGLHDTSVDPKSMSMGLAVGDYDNDNDLDIYITNFQLNSLFRNDGIGKAPGFWKWTDVAAPRGVEYPINCWGVDLVDLDLDGDLDIIQASGYIWSDVFTLEQQPRDNPDQVWLNNGAAQNYSFTAVGDASGFNSTMFGRGLATGDLDRDGDNDILVGNNTYYYPSPDETSNPGYHVYEGYYLLYRNDQDFGNNWVTLQLSGQVGILPGSVANRSAVGARVWLDTSDGQTQLREVQAGASFMSHNSLEVEFGLGDATIEEVRVRWPGQDPGEEEVFTGISHNAVWTIIEGEGEGIRVPVALVSFGARNLDRGVLVDWVSAPGIRTRSVELIRAPAAAPEQARILPTAQITLGQGGGQAFDATAEDGERYLYQIRLTAEDGFITMSSPAEIEVHHTGPSRIRRSTVGQNYPNPFNPSTAIQFELPRQMHARLVIYDVRGRQVRTLYNDVAAAGRTTVDWDGMDDRGQSVASGVYTYALTTEEGTDARQMTLVK